MEDFIVNYLNICPSMVIIGQIHLGNGQGNEQFTNSVKDWISEGINEVTNLFKSGKWAEVSQALLILHKV